MRTSTTPVSTATTGAPTRASRTSGGPSRRRSAPTTTRSPTIAPSKPFIIAETASTEYGGSKAAWITDMLSTQIPLYFPKLKGFLWFEKRDDAGVADRNLHHLEERLHRRHQIHLRGQQLRRPRQHQNRPPPLAREHPQPRQPAGLPDSHGRHRSPPAITRAWYDTSVRPDNRMALADLGRLRFRGVER